MIWFRDNVISKYNKCTNFLIVLSDFRMLYRETQTEIIIIIIIHAASDKNHFTRLYLFNPNPSKINQKSL